MNDSALVTVLEDAGLSPYQAEAYVTVLELGSASATDIAEECGVPDPRIYDVLRDLEERGYVETYEQDSLQARAFSPDTVLEDLRDRANKFEAAAEEIEHKWEEPALGSHTVSFFKRVETVLNNAEAKIREADNQIQVALSRPQYDRLRPALEAAHQNGVHVRLILQIDEEADQSLPPESELAAVATEARYRTVPMPFVLIVDRAVTCFAPHGSSMNRYGVIVEDRTHAYVFHWFFLVGLWEATASLYGDADDSLPRTYVNTRKCIQEVGPLLNDGATVSATVHGVDLKSGADVTFEGRIDDVQYPALTAAEDHEPYLGGQATIVIDTGDGTVEVGGWGAVIEEYEAHRIVVEDIAYS